MNIKKFTKLGEHLIKDKNYDTSDILGLIAINYYHLLDLLWDKTPKTCNKEYALYLYCLCLGYFSAGLTLAESDIRDAEKDLDGYRTLIAKDNLTIQEQITILLDEIDTSSTVMVVKIATLDIIIYGTFTDLKPEELYATAEKMCKN